MVRRACVVVLALTAACSSGTPAVAPPAATRSATVSPSAKASATKPASVRPTATSGASAAVYEFGRGQASLEIRGDAPFAGKRLLDRGFSAPPSGGEADGTYGWTDSTGDDRIVLNVPAQGPWTVSGVLDRSPMSFQQCEVRTERNDPGGLVGQFICRRVTRSGAVAPVGEAMATFSLEP